MGNCCTTKSGEEIRTTINIEQLMNEQNANTDLERRYEQMIQQIHFEDEEVEVRMRITGRGE